MNNESLQKRFSFERVALLIKNRALEDAPGLGIGLAALAGLNALTLVVAKTGFLTGSSRDLIPMVIAVTGLLLSAFAFRTMHDGKSGTDWILLPATSLEKYAAALASYLVIFPIVAALALSGLSAVLAVLERARGGAVNPVWHPFTPGALRAYGEYASVAVAFLAGSAAFRKHAFLKTVALFIAYVLVCASIVLGVLWLVYRSRGDGVGDLGFSNGTFRFDLEGRGDSDVLGRTANAAFSTIRYALLPLFALGYGYCRVAEKEARDEVQ